MKPIHYEKHPVSTERKAELIKQGVRIVDAVFKPVEVEAEAGAEPETELETVIEEVTKPEGAKTSTRKPK